MQTADGPWEPAQNLWGQTLRLAPRTLKILDYFTPPNLQELNANDLDYGSGGTLGFTFQNRPLVVSGGKDGTIYLLDAKSLGGSDHRTPLFSLKAGNDDLSYASMGVWGAPATYVNARNERWVYSRCGDRHRSRPPSRKPTAPLPMAASWHSSGDAKPGAGGPRIKRRQAGSRTEWVSRNLAVPDSPVIANGLVYAISTGENTLQRHTDPRYHAIYQKPGMPPLPKTGTMTAEERGQNDACDSLRPRSGDG